MGKRQKENSEACFFSNRLCDIYLVELRKCNERKIIKLFVI